MIQVPVFAVTSMLKLVSKSPVFESPVFKSPVFKLPVFESPVFKLPVFESPMFESTSVLESPLLESSVFYSSASHLWSFPHCSSHSAMLRPMFGYLRFQSAVCARIIFAKITVLVICVPVTFTQQLWQEFMKSPCIKIEALHHDSSIAFYIPSTIDTYHRHTFCTP